MECEKLPQIFPITSLSPHGSRKGIIMDLWYFSKLYLYCWGKYH